MTGVAFDTLKLAPRLREQAGFTPEHAEAEAEALAEAVGSTELVTRTDLASELPDLRAELRELEQRLTIKFGSMLIVAVGIILAAQRFFPAPHP